MITVEKRILVSNKVEFGGGGGKERASVVYMTRRTENECGGAAEMQGSHDNERKGWREREKEIEMRGSPGVFETGEAAVQLTMVCSSACLFGQRAANQGGQFKITRPVG